MIATRRPEAPPPLLVIFGPTAVGKSDLLFSLFDSRFEVISADSMQVYRGMDIGTAKPTREELERLPHHLLDIVEPSQQFNAGQFVISAERLMEEIRGRGRIPILCGGTAFYITSFLYGLPESPPGDPEVRERLRAMEREKGHLAMHELLAQRDPEAAEKIPANDRYRTIRALEVLETTGRSMYSFHWPRTPRADYRFCLVGLDRPREELYARIEARVERMFAAGLVPEVKRLVERGYDIGDPGMRGIGYRELLDTRRGCQTMDDAKELIVRNSRRYAKRQLTFFKAVSGVCWQSPDDADALRSRLRDFLGDAVAAL